MIKAQLISEIETFLNFNREKIEAPYIELFQQFELIQKRFKLKNIEECFNIHHSRLWYFCLSLISGDIKKIEESEFEVISETESLVRANTPVDQLFNAYNNAKIFFDFNHSLFLRPSLLLCILVNHYYSHNQNAPSTKEIFKLVIERFTEPFFINLATRDNLLKTKRELSTNFEYIRAVAILDGISYENLKQVLSRSYSDVSKTIFYRSHQPHTVTRIGQKTWELFDIIKNTYKIHMTITNSALVFISKVNMPEEFSRNLTYLNLSHNKFDRFPEFINELKSLTEFVFIDNPLNKQSTIWYDCPSLRNIKISPFQFKYLPLGLKRFGIEDQEYEYDIYELSLYAGITAIIYLIYKFFTSENFDLRFILGQFIVGISVAYCVQKKDIASKHGVVNSLTILLDDLDKKKSLQHRHDLIIGYQCKLPNDYIPSFNTFKKHHIGTGYFTGKAFKKHVETIDDAQLAELFEQTLNIR